MMLTHPPARRKSGTNVVDMKQSPREPVAIEITADNDTTFHTKDLFYAKAFLTALGETEVQMLFGKTSIQTGADIALLVLERAA